MSKNRDGLVRLIGAFKLVKGAFLIAVGVAALAAMPHDLAAFARRGIAWMGLGLFPGHEGAHRAVGKLRHVDPATAKRFGVLCLAYATVFVVEGVGLLLKQRWAEWLTVVVTGSFIPIEIYELVKEASAGKVIALVLNVAILVYLIARRVAERRQIGARILRAVGAT
jgi:uncharacterized membrane protein (DUF2068 family)